MPAPILLDLSHTAHTRARTGIQRVTRSLLHALGDDAVPLTFDPYRRVWRELASWEHANLAAPGPAARRGARWPWHARWRGRLARWTRAAAAPLPAHRGVVVPELFSPLVGAALPALSPSLRGPRVALFHDAIALKLPEHTPTKTVARFPAYLRELLQFDGIAAVSEDSRRALVDYWEWSGARATPPVVTLPLGVDPRVRPAAADAAGAPSGPPIVLSVGSIEGRKNHLALLEACARLWQEGRNFELRLVGLAQPETGAAALARIEQLRAAGRPLRYDGPVSDAAIDAAYAQSAFTVYPSLMEGFGLPVLESLAHGRPCICSGQGALGEAAKGGGCVMLDTVDAPSLAAAIERLLADSGERERLTLEATQRPQRTWADYARELRSWMGQL